MTFCANENKVIENVKFWNVLKMSTLSCYALSFETVDVRFSKHFLLLNISNLLIFSIFLFSSFWTDIKPKRLFKTPRIKSENRNQTFINGYRFVIASQSPSTLYLKCANFRNRCGARASKRKDTGDTFVTKSRHSLTCHHVDEPVGSLGVWTRKN